MEIETLPKDLSDLMGKRLSDYTYEVGYYLELCSNSGLIGSFHALILEEKNKRFLVCTNKSLLEKVWKLLPARSNSRISEMPMIVNTDNCIGFNFIGGLKATPFNILSEDEFENLISDEKKPFAWSNE
ncbi:hypothetical protein HON59_03015 [bacterium]|jgi:hypothetical protein|nr:hypothetical protein [bacterium]MBT3730026.1 hypothetical protein [bacterium]MBT4895002.1 hypothetical protein [bacterium]